MPRPRSRVRHRARNSPPACLVCERPLPLRALSRRSDGAVAVTRVTRCSCRSVVRPGACAGCATGGDVDEDVVPDVLAQVQTEAASTWRSPVAVSTTVRGAERLRASGPRASSARSCARYPLPTSIPRRMPLAVWVEGRLTFAPARSHPKPSLSGTNRTPSVALAFPTPAIAPSRRYRRIDVDGPSLDLQLRAGWHE